MKDFIALAAKPLEILAYGLLTVSGLPEIPYLWQVFFDAQSQKDNGDCRDRGVDHWRRRHAGVTAPNLQPGEDDASCRSDDRQLQLLVEDLPAPFVAGLARRSQRGVFKGRPELCH